MVVSIAIAASRRWQAPHVRGSSALISILEILPLRCLALVAPVCRLVGVRIRHLVAMPSIHHLTLALVLLIQRRRVPLNRTRADRIPISRLPPAAGADGRNRSNNGK
ncbi:MAG: hypothetical protein JJD97_11585 [Gemmatimonadaceae bacterium]|nr:hypothetical protein [Gemmatimonadaceae bacterium]